MTVIFAKCQGGMTSVWVDDADAPVVSSHRWYASTGRRSTTMYAHASINGKTVYMHRLILGACAGEIVDHRDGNGRNNSRENLRLCTGTQNNGNRRRQKTALAQFKGVTFDKQTGRWKSQLTIHGRNHHLGRFNSQEEAAVAYNSAARVHFGEFALLNGAP